MLKMITQSYCIWVGWVPTNYLVPPNFWVSGRYTTCLATHHKEVKWMNERNRNLFTWNKTFKNQWTWDYRTLTFKGESLNPKLKRYYLKDTNFSTHLCYNCNQNHCVVCFKHCLDKYYEGTWMIHFSNLMLGNF